METYIWLLHQWIYTHINIVLMYEPFPIFILSICVLFRILKSYIILDSQWSLQLIYYILLMSSPTCYLYVLNRIIKLVNEINVPVLPTPALIHWKLLPAMKHHFFIIWQLINNDVQQFSNNIKITWWWYSLIWPSTPLKLNHLSLSWVLFLHT